MPTTFEAAYDEITDQFKTGWAAEAPAIVGFLPEVRFTGVEEGSLPQDHFCRFTLDPVIEAQASLRDGENGQRYESEGLIIIQVFTWRKNPQAEEFGRRLSVVARDIFRGKTFLGCILFRNVRINRLEAEAKYWRYNVIAEYQYDEIG